MFGVRESKDPDLRMVVPAEDLFGENLPGGGPTSPPTTRIALAQERGSVLWTFDESLVRNAGSPGYPVRLVPPPDAGRHLA